MPSSGALTGAVGIRHRSGIACVTRSVLVAGNRPAGFSPTMFGLRNASLILCASCSAKRAFSTTGEYAGHQASPDYSSFAQSHALARNQRIVVFPSHELRLAELFVDHRRLPYTLLAAFG